MKPNTIDRRTDWMERAAVMASIACLIHCLALPIAVAMLPAFAQALRLPPAFHVWMILLVVPMSTMALIRGRAGHRAVRPLAIGLTGLILLIAGALLFGETGAETPLTVAGSLTLGWAHAANWRLRHMRMR